MRRGRGGDPGRGRGHVGKHVLRKRWEGLDCLCSRASVANWSVWVQSVGEDPRRRLAVCWRLHEAASSVVLQVFEPRRCVLHVGDLRTLHQTDCRSVVTSSVCTWR